MSMSNFLKDLFFNVTLRYSPLLDYYYIPSYVALYSSDPTEEDIEAGELSGSGYKRQMFPVNRASIYRGSARNYLSITFPVATGSWLDVPAYVGIRSGSEAGENSGDLLFFGQIGATSIIPGIAVNEGENLVIPAGALTVNVRGAARSDLSDDMLYRLLVNSYPGEEYEYMQNQKYLGLFTESYTGEFSGNPDTYPPMPIVSYTPQEVSGGGYARIPCGSWTEPESGSTCNIGLILFTTAATEDWGEIKAVGINYASESGSFLYIGNLSEPKTINAGDYFAIESGSLVLQVV